MTLAPPFCRIVPQLLVASVLQNYGVAVNNYWGDLLNHAQCGCCGRSRLPYLRLLVWPDFLRLDEDRRTS